MTIFIINVYKQTKTEKRKQKYNFERRKKNNIIIFFYMHVISIAVNIVCMYKFNNY
jgi:hypothetical protein